MATPPEILIPITDQTAYLSRVHVGVTIPLLALCLVPFSARLYIRIWPKWRVGWDDVLIVAGFMFAVADWALLQFEMFMTPRLLPLPAALLSMKLAYLAIPVWSCAMTCIKISVALTLLRIPHGRAWKAFIYTITGLQTAYFIGNTVFTFMACIPLAAIWDYSLRESAVCLGSRASYIASSVGSAINITTDVLFSLAPMVILLQLRRPLRERILVCALMGIGLVASAASIAKAIVIKQWGDQTTDVWALAVTIATLTIVEQFLALMAACSPALKGPLQRLLGSIGIQLTNYNSHISFIHVRRSGVAAGGIPDEKHPASGQATRCRAGDGDNETGISASASAKQSDWSGQSTGDDGAVHSSAARSDMV